MHKDLSVHFPKGESNIPKTRKEVANMENQEALRKRITLDGIFRYYHTVTIKPNPVTNRDEKITNYTFSNTATPDTHGLHGFPLEDRVLMIGTAREGVIPIFVPGKVQREGKLVWAYCWIKYLNKENYMPVIQTDGTSRWRSCRDCLSSVRVFLRDYDLPRFKLKMQIVNLKRKDPKLRNYEVISERKYYGITKNEKIYDRAAVVVSCVDIGSDKSDRATSDCPSLPWNLFTNFNAFSPKKNCTDACYKTTNNGPNKGVHYSPTLGYGYTNEKRLLLEGKLFEIPKFVSSEGLKSQVKGFYTPLKTVLHFWVDLVSYSGEEKVEKLEGLVKNVPRFVVEMKMEYVHESDMVLKFK